MLDNNNSINIKFDFDLSLYLYVICVLFCFLYCIYTYVRGTVDRSMSENLSYKIYCTLRIRAVMYLIKSRYFEISNEIS